MSSSRPVLERLTTGSVAFDRILGGGLPVRSVNVIAGEPGAGKTLFSLQMLFALANATSPRQRVEQCLVNALVERSKL